MKDKYVFKPYSPIFPELFEKEKARIASHMTKALAIEHVGSTAVPGLGGKGIIDIAIAVADQEDMNEVKENLESLGYTFRPAFSTPHRLYFIIYLPDPEEGTRRYHVHLSCLESSEWKDLIRFRDHLRAHPQEAENYAELKKRAVIEAGQDGAKYRELKDPLFKKVLSNIEATFKIIAYGSEDYAKAVALREEILRKPLGLRFTPEELELEKEHIHIAGFLHGRLCATAVLVKEGDDLKMQRVAISSDLQSKGIGSALLIFCEQYARRHHFNSIYCHARGSAISFYLKNHYVLEGEAFNEDGIPHHKMRKYFQ